MPDVVVIGGTSGIGVELVHAYAARTPTGRNVHTRDIVHASVFLLKNPSANGVNLEIDGGWVML
jgi:NAD(P)-dependent dehydrogenase (short-subunit alcohol dehydrogenase family)